MKKALSVLSLAVQLLVVCVGIFDYWQAKYVSESLPANAVNHIAEAYLWVALATLPILLYSIYAHRKRQYMLVVLLGILVLLWDFFGERILGGA